MYGIIIRLVYLAYLLFSFGHRLLRAAILFQPSMCQTWTVSAAGRKSPQAMVVPIMSDAVLHNGCV